MATCLWILSKVLICFRQCGLHDADAYSSISKLASCSGCNPYMYLSTTPLKKLVSSNSFLAGYLVTINPETLNISTFIDTYVVVLFFDKLILNQMCKKI